MSHPKLKATLLTGVMVLLLLPASGFTNNVNLNTVQTDIGDKLSFQQEIQKIMSVISNVNLGSVDKSAAETFQNIQQFKAKFYMGGKDIQSNNTAPHSPVAPAPSTRDAF